MIEELLLREHAPTRSGSPCEEVKFFRCLADELAVTVGVATDQVDQQFAKVKGGQCWARVSDVRVEPFWTIERAWRELAESSRPMTTSWVGR